MGAGAELLLLPLGATALFALIAFFAAFFNRTAARIWELVTIAVFIVFHLLILDANHWDLEWQCKLFLEASPINGILDGSLLLSLAAALLPLRREDRRLPGGACQKGGPRWVILVPACFVVLVLAGYGVQQLGEGWQGTKKTRALLSGDTNVHFERLQIDGHQLRLICTNPVVLRYLEDRFRRADTQYQGLGVSYYLSLSFVGGGSQKFGTYWGDSGDFKIFLSDAADGGQGFAVLLTHPRPKQVDVLVRFLLGDDHLDVGTVLILDSGGSRFERDESIIVR